MIKNSNYRIGNLRIHAISWTVFIIWEVVFVGLFFGDFGSPVTYVLHYLLIIILFYLHVLRLLPWALEKGKQALWKIPLIFSLETAGFLIFSFTADKILIRYGFIASKTELKLNIHYVIKTLYRELYFLGFSTGLYYLATYQQERKKTENLEKSRLKEIIERQKAEEEVNKARNAFLLAQINPHFFFNTLDYLYHNVLETSPKSAEAISILAAMMRFVIDADKVGEFIRLGDEIDQVENLIYLNQLRERLAIRIEVDDDAKDLMIIPLVLLTLTENIFKHGNLKANDQEAVIQIYLAGENLHIETKNLINRKKEASGMKNGLDNIDKRLKNAYGRQLLFQYGLIDPEIFKVNIKIASIALSPAGIFSYPSVNIDKE